MSKTQNQLVLDHMIDHGFITPLIAFGYRIMRLAARIQELEAQGVRINCEIRSDDAGKRYAYYTLYDRACELRLRALGKSWNLKKAA